MNSVFGGQRSPSLEMGYLFIDDEWCRSNILLWALNLMTCVTHHFCTPRGEFNRRELFCTFLFPCRYDFWAWFLGLMDYGTNSLFLPSLWAPEVFFLGKLLGVIFLEYLGCYFLGIASFIWQNGHVTWFN